jgi:hypothetical protein
MVVIDDLVNDAEMLVNYADTNKIDLPAEYRAILVAAKSNVSLLARPGKEREDFFSAFQAVSATIDIPAASLRASVSRRKRLLPVVEDALRLLEFASANAKPVEDDIRNPLLAAVDSILKGNPSVADQQSFLKAYQALTMKTAPVTADTLEASKTKLPDFDVLFSKEGIARTLKGLTLGRFINAIVFVIVLIITCVSLSYYSLGSSSLIRYREVGTSLRKLETELPRKQELVDVLRKAELKLEASKATPEKETLEKNLGEASRLLQDDEKNIKEFQMEHDAIPDRLWKWSQQPCTSGAAFAFYWTLCSAIDRVPENAPEPNGYAKVEAARTVAARLSDIYLPLLLGWLGAYAFILRKMTKEIGENSFAKSSALHHIVRLGLGALAGFSSTWLLTPEAVGGVALKTIPAWALAFVAGYGIELVFSFMDRIISAFTTKTN